MNALLWWNANSRLSVSHDFLTDLIDRIVVAVHVAENPHKRESADWPGYNDLERCYLWASSDFADNKLPLALFGADHSYVRFATSAESMKNLSNINREAWNSASRPNSDEPRSYRDRQIIRPWEKPPFIKLGRELYTCVCAAGLSKTGSLIY